MSKLTKAQLIEKCVEAGLSAEGTVKALKDRLAAFAGKPVKAVSVKIKKNSDREKYLHSAHQPKLRKLARNLQVAK